MDDSAETATPRFVLLWHHIPTELQAKLGPSHFDLMLEKRGVLVTWRIPRLPSGPFPARFSDLGIACLPPHRIAYLDYEGPISGERGYVQRVDCGRYTLVHTPQNHTTKTLLLGKEYKIELLLPLGCQTTRLSAGPLVHTSATNAATLQRLALPRSKSRPYIDAGGGWVLTWARIEKNRIQGL